MREIIQRVREHEFWPWLLTFIGLMVIAVEVALAMTYPDPVIQGIGMALFFFGLCSLIWGLCMTEDNYGKPDTFIDWGPYTIVRWCQALTVTMLIVYAVLPIWQAAILLSAIVTVSAVYYIPSVCRFMVPEYYMWLGEGALHRSRRWCRGK